MVRDAPAGAIAYHTSRKIAEGNIDPEDCDLHFVKVRLALFWRSDLAES